MPEYSEQDLKCAAEGREGALCLTVYDKSLSRFVVIMASATD